MFGGGCFVPLRPTSKIFRTSSKRQFLFVIVSFVAKSLTLVHSKTRKAVEYFNSQLESNPLVAASHTICCFSRRNLSDLCEWPGSSCLSISCRISSRKCFLDTPLWEFAPWKNLNLSGRPCRLARSFCYLY